MSKAVSTRETIRDEPYDRPSRNGVRQPRAQSAEDSPASRRQSWGGWIKNSLTPWKGRADKESPEKTEQMTTSSGDDY